MLNFRRATRWAAALTTTAALVTTATSAFAQINIGVSLSLTGPGSALGIPTRGGLELWPTEIAGEKINMVIIDDTGDPSVATRNARKFTSEDKVDLLLGSNLTPGGIALSSVAQETQTPHFSFAPIPLPPGKADYSFVVPQSVALMANAVIKDIKARKFKSIGLIGFSDPWGEQWFAALSKGIEGTDIKIVANEKYGRADTSVTGQVLKLVSATPDAILIAGSGTGAALPQTALAERGYKGQIYQTHGAGSGDFLRIAGKSAEGAILPIGPVLVPSQLADNHPSKKIVTDFVKAFTAKFGEKSPVVFGAHGFDALQILQRAIPEAKKSAKPGTPEFRKALKIAIESQKEVPGVNGVYNFTATDHYGLDERGSVLVQVVNGDWKVLK
jgi:branched-chain amino acid transport system substrate-binding protein